MKRSEAVLWNEIRLRAFTLIEILVVVSIIAILAALLLPVFSSMRQSAGVATSTSNLKTLASATQLYVSENGGYLPRADGRNSDVGLDWPQGLRPYGGSLALPEPATGQNPVTINPAGVSDEYPKNSLKTSYSMNGNLQKFQPPPQGESTAPVVPIPMAAIVTPTKTVLFADMLYAGRAMNFGHMAYRNKNGKLATVVFIDGHVEAVAPGVLSFEKNFAQPPRD